MSTLKYIQYVLRHKALAITTLLSLIFTIGSYGQSNHRKNYFPVWTFHQDSINIHGISLGLWSFNIEPRYTNTNGIRLELIGGGIIVPLIPRSPIAEADSEFNKLKQEPLSERINGLNLSTSGNVCNCLTNGIIAGVIGQFNFQVNGISTALLNFTQKHNGVMTAMFNYSYKMNGLQFGFANNGYQTKGIQIGIVKNNANEMNGIQIGIFNKSKKLKGVQIGLWNINPKRKLPFINWSFKRDIE